MAQQQNLKQALQQAPQDKKPQTVKDLLTSPDMLKQIQHALPKHMSGERMARVMLTAMRTTPKLATCEPASFMGAVMQLSQLGLEPGGHLGHAYLIPFDRSVKVGNQWQKVPEVQVIIGYRGMLDLARRSGQILSITSRVIYEKDSYTIGFGLEPTLEHVPAFGEVDRGKPIFFYAVAKLKDGGTQFEVMSVNEVNAIRDKSQGYLSAQRKAAEKQKDIDHPWATNYDEMGKKTVTRRLFKWLPVSIEIQTAVGLDEATDANLSQHNALTLEGDFRIGHDEFPDDDDAPEAQPEKAIDPLQAAHDAMVNATTETELNDAWDLVSAAKPTKSQEKELNAFYTERLDAIAGNG